MCGICGFVATTRERPGRDVLEAMNQRILHRGPDEDGVWLDGPAALAMRRLAIIDLSGGRQPIFNEDGSVGTVFNGEIYNYHELRARLEQRGHRFSTNSDTETIVHLYEEHGEDAFSHLNGMFAIALWDSRRQRLLLARDRAGKKPLYYTRAGAGIVFSSELHSLLAYPGISREIDYEALDNYFLYGYVPAPLSIYRDVRKLEAGSVLTLEKGQAGVRRYWRLTPPAVRRISEPDAAGELLELLTDAVRIRLHSDVPFGALLSGGVDSSLVVGLMSGLMSKPVQAFTISFADGQLDETPYAAEVARRFGAEHHVLRCDPPAVPQLAASLVQHFGEPFADSSALPTLLVSQLARRHVTMVLSGDGGDEVFGGYPSYRYHHLIDSYQRAVPAALRPLLSAAASWMPGGGRPASPAARALRFLREAELPVQTRWSHSRGWFSEAELDELYSPELAARVRPERRSAHLRESFAHFLPRAGARSINFVDYETYMVDDVLVKVDRMSMAASLEVRSPLLDFRIAEFAAALPPHYKWTARDGKRILKRAAASLLPAPFMNRPKQGFVVPLRKWFQHDLLPYVRSVYEESAGRALLRREAWEALLDRHQRFPKAGTERKIWSVLSFLLWYDRYGSTRGEPASR